MKKIISLVIVLFFVCQIVSAEPTRSVTFEMKAEKIEKDVDGSTTYWGFAPTNATITSAKWAIIRKVDTGDDWEITFADGNFKKDNIWNNRTSLTYK